MTTYTPDFKDTRYPSLRDYIAAATVETPRYAGNADLLRQMDDGSVIDGAGWAGAANTKGAVEALSAAYADGDAIIKRVEKAALSIKLPPTMDTRRRRVRGDQGDELDIHAVWRGNHDTAWSRMGRRQVTAPPMVSIVINSIITGDSEKTVISYRGAVGIVICQLLERAGYRVRLIVARGGIGGKERNDPFSCRTTIKDYGKPLDRETVACATHPAMQRILGIRWSWAQGNTQGDNTGNSVAEAVKDKGEIFISKEVSNERNAIARINAIIKEITK